MFKFLKALSVFAGTIIGVGIFGLPYVASKAGFSIVLLYFLTMSGMAIVIHLMYGKIALQTKTLYRLPGYAEEYLGSPWKKITFLVIGLGLTGALLAYLIVGGNFLNLFFSPYFGGNALIYTFLFFAAGALLIFRGIKNISQVELFFLIVFFALLILFFVRAFPFIDLDHFKSVDFKFFTFPYGVVLFSLWGSALIPEVKEILENNGKLLKKVIITGILLSAVTYLFFIFTILGVSGPNTSKEAISGFAQDLGNGVIRLGFIFGIITCFTSFITLGLTLKKVLWYDFGLAKNFSWLITCFLPLALFLLGFRQFIDVIGITGAIALGVEAILIVFIYRAFLKKKLFQKMNPLLYLLPIFFVLGVFFEVFYFIFAK
ncbi:MAG: hypothetical protein COT59_00760 [Candidatus Nealsonbacteria bacterium CG09_land_8_20_14_0_10_42_14]|uniref:Amino acid transporter transmembrane domain-containing protein n=1 Tax=Candidatus Nealsonbacteria bacterium CG09_land_8_20_14_0_10_42_14 TaxID=1974707 RepID=A0A2H0WXS5_9BACT|nr:MAG: hypothetical protein COT59_00760 [Candidatus Nealsonbacteria bacterium CG09_land_8_20_14_0_10_42_14]